MKYIEVSCDNCGNNYLKLKKEYNRNIIKHRNNYCSKICKSKDKRVTYKISNHSNNRIDEYTDFKYVYKILKTRMKKECNVTLKDLKDLWEIQKGICPYTGISLKLIKHGYKFQDISKNRYDIASLDRIDSSKGYIKGNLCYVSTLVNFMKNNCSIEETVSFMFIIKNYLSDKKDDDIVCAVKKFTEL